MTSCGRPSPTRLAVGSSTCWSATVTSAPAGWPARCRSPARRSPSIWPCSNKLGWSAGANRAGRFSTRWRPTASTRPPGPWLTSPRSGTGASARSNGSPKRHARRKPKERTAEALTPGQRGRSGPRRRSDQPWQIGPTNRDAESADVRRHGKSVTAAARSATAARFAVALSGDPWAGRHAAGYQHPPDARHGHGGRHQARFVCFLLPSWISMMAAMMLPGGHPGRFADARCRRTPSGRRSSPRLYIAVWAVVGVAVYDVVPAPWDRRRWRRRNRRRALRADARSSATFAGNAQKTIARASFSGSTASGSSIGLMAILVVVGVMSLTWMAWSSPSWSPRSSCPPRPYRCPARPRDRRARHRDPRSPPRRPRAHAPPVPCQ